MHPAVKPIAADYRDTLRRVLAQRPVAEDVARRTVAAGLRTVYLVGCGGSNVTMTPTQYLLDTRAHGFATFQLSSAELVHRRPPRLGPSSLVILASHTGTTPETLEAARVGRAAGATVVAVSRAEDTPLALASDVAFAYRSEDTINDAKHILVGQLGLALLHEAGDLDEYGVGVETYERLPDVLFGVKVATEERNSAIAEALGDAAVTYVVASGPVVGVATLFAMCFLQEMQWMHAAAFNAGEFLHGAMEVITGDVPLIVLLGEDETRPMAERVREFARRTTSNAIAVDSRDLELPAVPEAWRPVVAPLALSSVMTRLASHLEAVRGHDLDERRYMGRMAY